MRRPEDYEHKLKPSELLVHERSVALTVSRPEPVGSQTLCSGWEQSDRGGRQRIAFSPLVCNRPRNVVLAPQ